MNDSRSEARAHRLAALGLSMALVACGEPRTARAPSPFVTGEPFWSWDKSSIHRVGADHFAFAGPVLHLSGSEVDPAQAPAVSRRCLSIALGTPYLQPHEPNAPASQTELWFDSKWTPSDARRRHACAEAFGRGWRLPTFEQAAAVFGPRAAPFGWDAVFVRDEQGNVETLRRETELCQEWKDPDCKPYARVQRRAAEAGSIYCAALPHDVPPAEPSDAEITRCVGIVTKAIEGRQAVPTDLVDERALDFVFAVRRACKSNRNADYDTILAWLRRELGATTLSDRSQDLSTALFAARDRVGAAQQALSAFRDVTKPVDCSEARERYRRTCSDAAHRADCVAWQAQYAAQCLGTHPSELLVSLSGRLEQMAGEAAMLFRRQQTIARATRIAAECANEEKTRARLGEITGPAKARPSQLRRYCACALDDLNCGLAALRDPSKCPDHPSQSHAKKRCGCAEGDLACEMKCSGSRR